ncbi:hypothetical protein [Methylorubrum populi]
MVEIERAIERAGGEVVAAYSSFEPDAITDPTSYADLAIIDVDVRGRMIYQLADFYQTCGLPFLFATGMEIADIPDRFAPTLKIMKPYNMDDLIWVASRCLQ